MGGYGYDHGDGFTGMYMSKRMTMYPLNMYSVYVNYLNKAVFKRSENSSLKQSTYLKNNS